MILRQLHIGPHHLKDNNSCLRTEMAEGVGGRCKDRGLGAPHTHELQKYRPDSSPSWSSHTDLLSGVNVAAN